MRILVACEESQAVMRRTAATSSSAPVAIRNGTSWRMFYLF